MRGNQRADVLRGELDGSIPACAGEPLKSRSRFRGSTVYPRVCGGTLFDRIDQVLSEGLSPRVRGNPIIAEAIGPRGGSIPACAGEPLSRFVLRSSTRVYPRVCGGTVVVSRLDPRVTGLSPRVRGNPTAGGWCLENRGSIPACAGEPPSLKSARPRNRVYPRVCGGT